MTRLFYLSLAFFLYGCASPALTPTETPAVPTLTVAVIRTLSPTETTVPTMTETAPATFDQATLDAMSPQAKLDAAPASADGYVASNVSSVKDNLVIYRDAQGKAVQVYDLLSGTFESPEQAGIAELDLNDGTKWEMRMFTDIESTLDYMSKNSKVETEDRIRVIEGIIHGQEYFDYFSWVKKNVASLVPKKMMGINLDESRYYVITVQEVNGNMALVSHIDPDGKWHSILLDDPAVENDANGF